MPWPPINLIFLNYPWDDPLLQKTEYGFYCHLENLDLTLD